MRRRGFIAVQSYLAEYRIGLLISDGTVGLAHFGSAIQRES